MTQEVQDPKEAQEVYKITVNTTGYRPELDPSNPAFDAEAYKKEVGPTIKKIWEESGGKEMLEEQQQAFQRLASELSKVIPEKMQIAEKIKTATDAARIAEETIATFLKSDYFQLLKNSVAALSTYYQEHKEEIEAFAGIADDARDLVPFLKAELEDLKQDPAFADVTIYDLFAVGFDADGNVTDSPFKQAIERAKQRRAEYEAIQILDSQIAGRELRRQLKANAKQQGALMSLHTESLPVFSQRDLWDAFAPGRIAKMGALSEHEISKKTGRIEKARLDDGDIIPLNATEISYKTFMLLNAIMANSVENFREYFIADGSITFYVKGVLDSLEIDPRIKDDQQLTIDRKTAGVLYLEKQFEPLLTFIGTAPDGSRYSVLNYEGYNAESDTITIRTPYLFRLWENAQGRFVDRKHAKERRIAEGKKPLKADLKPLEVNTLFKRTAYKEDDITLEIATYITNVLLNAGKGAHKTEIAFTTLIKNCPRLQERLATLDDLPATEALPDGKRRNNTARYNSELRKIAQAYNLIMNPEKCDALKYFDFSEFSPTQDRNGKRAFIPPTKSTLKEKIVIRWKRIDPEEA